MNLVVTLNYIFGQIISFCVPLIVIGFIAPSITKLGKNASRLLGVALILAYTSSLGAALFSMAAGYTLIPHMSIRRQSMDCAVCRRLSLNWTFRRSWAL